MRMSTRPNSASAFWASASTSSFLPTSARTGSALTPRSRASRATDSASCWLARALTTTCAPSPASCSTVARPILRPEPVTSATFPSSLPMSHLHDDVREVEEIGLRWQRQNRWCSGVGWVERSETHRVSAPSDGFRVAQPILRLRVRMTEEPKPDKQKRKLPRVSAASGGLLPGVNLEDGSLEEAEDLEYVERL